MKIILLATPEIALPVYHALHSSHQLLAVLTQTDKPVGRSKQLVPSPIAQAAAADGVAIYKADKITPELTAQLCQLGADIFVTFAYGVILPRDFLNMTPRGGINIHPSMLPKLRGPSPMQTALLLGEPTGITVQQIAYKVDSGDILYQEQVEITDETDILSLTEYVSNRSADIILDVLKNIENGTIVPKPQDESAATFCRMISKEDGRIDWHKPVREIFNQIRAFSAWPVAFSVVEGQKILFHKAIPDGTGLFDRYKDCADGQIVILNRKDGIYIKCSDGLLRIMRLQLQGKNILDDKDFANGGQRFLNKILES
ncbi:MAG: methionyl-tRNA formyltransferase [Spirochaetales bacterium]|nr:methionyl-tRNA formyltransferase [Spirochaetales bacterium]